MVATVMGLIELGQYAAAITAILVLAGIAIKWGIVTPIKTYIDQATYPIHPEANGDYRLNSIEELVTKPATRSKKTTN
jgi:uncharacterized oligopeptide transporter (OPT) family protein